MASITGTGSFGGARWLLGAALRWLHPVEQTVAAADQTPARSAQEKKRWHPPRNAMLEQATMAREMYRL